MPSRPSHLPDYKNPPVIEVALAVQFSDLSNFRSVHSGLLWNVFKRKFPNFSEHPPIAPTFETFGGKTGQNVMPQVRLVAGPPIPRFWFIDRNDSQLIQFQIDRFAHNWRKVGTGDRYPRYEFINKQFLSELRKLKKFLKDNEIGKIHPNQAEITYVNHIISEGGEDLTRSLGTVFRHWSNRRYDKDLATIETSRFQVKFVVPGEDRKPIGRLHVTVEPATHSDGTPMVRFMLVARGQPAKPTMKSVSEFLDIGREKIVLTFTEMTSEKMHKRWGRSK